MGKKKRDQQQQQQEAAEQVLQNGGGGCSDEKKKKKKINKNDCTVSIALPGSIIDNVQSFELATRLAGQIARAATIFRIDEVVVFDNQSTSSDHPPVTADDENESGTAFLIRILKYLETPQYLRKTLFPKHNSLRFVGLLPPLDAPHHLRKHEWAPYREGVTLVQQAPSSANTLVDVGLSKNVVIDQALAPGTRVTVAMGTERQLDDKPRQIVSSSKPKEESGMYWGYKVRYAANISSVMNGCPYEGGYDYLIGTSEHGHIVKSSELELPSFRHLLIAFGGLAGLEECIEEDKNFKGKDPREVFSTYLNICPHQGSRTIRTEEALFISLQYFQEPIDRVSQNSN
ncbi:methyltransferase [Artemisia annua]|uniref:Methyltransferase n=1 Tax=Artemisia annua TaxID=35608 RepID=A0A2U1MZH4_ARTAN|nr:methyltransferase [Artemisia annua]